MPQLVVAGAAAWAGAAAAEYAAFTLLAGAFGSAVIGAVAAGVVTAVATKALSDGAGGGAGGAIETRRLNTSVRQAAAARRLIYGESKLGGVLVYPAQSEDGEYVWLAVYLGEGPIEAIDPVFWLADELSTDAKFDGLLTLTAKLGNPGQTADTELIDASGGEWTSNDVGTGVAYAITKFKWDRNAFPRGLVFPVFKVKGRKLFDPRTNTTQYSANPALIMLDLIRSEYGYAAPNEWIDFDTFAAAASICDEILDSLDPVNEVNGVSNKVRRYTFNGALETSANPANLVEEVEKACGGKLIFSGGKYRFYAGAWRAPTGTINKEHLRGDPTFRTHPGRQQLINTVRATYREPKQDWQTSEIPQIQLAQAVIDEAGEIVQSLDFPGVTIGAQAQRLARLAMNQARSSVPLVLQCNYSVFQWRLYDTVYIDLPEVGASGTYLITQYNFSDEGGIDMSLVPHLASDFAWSTANETIPTEVIRPNFNRFPQAVDDLFVSGFPIDIGDGTIVPTLSATWDASNFAQIKHYEVQWKESSSEDWNVGSDPAVFGIRSGIVTTPNWQQSNLTINIEYDVRVRVVAEDDSFGLWAEFLNTTVSGDTTPPGPPTNLSVTGTGTHTITWTTPTDLDILRSIVWVNDVNLFLTSTQLTTVFGIPGTQYQTTNTVTGTRYYWVQSLDRSGNTSAKTFAGTAS
jgi:hypothetical protein